MPVRNIIPTIKLPVKVKNNKELKNIIEYFKSRENDVVVSQLEKKKTFHDKIKFLRFMGYVE